MTAEELSIWMQYRQKNGPLNPMLRSDAAIARLAAVVGSTRGHKLKPSDFMPWPREEPQSASPQEVLQYMTALVKKRTEGDGGK